MRWRRSEPDWRLFKQLEFSFPPQIVITRSAVVEQPLWLPLEGGTRSPSALRKIYAPSAPELISSSEKPIHLRRRDHALESRAREFLRSLGADKLGREVRVEWNPRLKTCAGRADYRQKLISLNPLLRNLNDELGQTKFNTPQRECKKHSRLTDHPGNEEVVDKLECKKHSSLTSKVGSVSGRSERWEVVRDEIDRTLRHELAHLFAQWRVGRRRIAPHGVEWRRACRELGIADETRCHNLPFAAKVYVPRYIYRCPNCKEEYLRVRRILRAIACLACCRKYSGGDFDPRFRLKLINRE